MRLKQCVFCVVGMIYVTFTAGCASGPRLDSYPRREIDRPFTLPSGVANWHIPVVAAYAKDNSSSTTLPPIPVPLLWEQSLSDDWNLIWFPLPLGFAHQIENGATYRTGFSVFTGFSYGTLSGFRLQPNFIFSYRHKFSEDTALDVAPQFIPDIPFKSGQEFRWSAGLMLRPVFQLGDTFALEPRMNLGATEGRSDSPVQLKDVNLATETTFTLSLGLGATWSMGRQWDCRPSYSYSGIGAKNGYESHVGMIEFVHFW